MVVYSLPSRGLIAGRAVWFYAAKLAWPHPIIFFYPRWNIDGHLWWQYLFPAAAIAFVVTLWLARRRIGRGPLSAALIFGGILVPAIGFFNVFPFRYSFVADHFQHHATLTPSVLAAAGAAMFDRRLCGATAAASEPSKNFSSARLMPAQTIWRATAGLVLLVLATISFRQCFTYYDVETLYTDIIKKNPTCWVAFSNLGAFLSKEGRSEEATVFLQQAP